MSGAIEFVDQPAIGSPRYAVASPARVHKARLEAEPQRVALELQRLFLPTERLQRRAPIGRCSEPASAMCSPSR
jgi:hypothetical protein